MRVLTVLNDQHDITPLKQRLLPRHEVWWSTSEAMFNSIWPVVFCCHNQEALLIIEHTGHGQKKNKRCDQSFRSFVMLVGLVLPGEDMAQIDASVLKWFWHFLSHLLVYNTISSQLYVRFTFHLVLKTEYKSCTSHTKALDGVAFTKRLQTYSQSIIINNRLITNLQGEH